jgi:hypothetical protein
MKITFLWIPIIPILLFSCNTKNTNENLDNKPVQQLEIQTDTLVKHLKPFNHNLPTIGLLMYDGVLTTEVTAAADVFTKPTEEGVQLFNVITIAENAQPIVSEEGLKINC